MAVTATANTAGEGSIDLSWGATALGGSFDGYIVEMQMPDGTWRQIAEGTVEATSTYSVEHVRRSVAETFGVRVRHTNGTYSARSATASATLTKAGSYLIVPEEPSLSRAVALNMPGVGFGYQRDREETTRFGRRYKTASRLPFDRGVTLTGTVDTTDVAGWVAAAEWTRDLLDAEVEQFVLVNDVGERWIVDVEFGDGTVMFSAGETGDWQQVPFRAMEVDHVPVVVQFS